MSFEDRRSTSHRVAPFLYKIESATPLISSLHSTACLFLDLFTAFFLFFDTLLCFPISLSLTLSFFTEDELWLKQFPSADTQTAQSTFSPSLHSSHVPRQQPHRDYQSSSRSYHQLSSQAYHHNRHHNHVIVGEDDAESSLPQSHVSLSHYIDEGVIDNHDHEMRDVTEHGARAGGERRGDGAGGERMAIDAPPTMNYFASEWEGSDYQTYVRPFSSQIC